MMDARIGTDMYNPNLYASRRIPLRPRTMVVVAGLTILNELVFGFQPDKVVWPASVSGGRKMVGCGFETSLGIPRLDLHNKDRSFHRYFF